MNARAQPTDSERLRGIRRRLASVPDGDWSLGFTGGASVIVRPGPSFREGVAGDEETLLTFSDAATTDDMQLVADAVPAMRFLLGLVDRAWRRIDELAPAPKPERRKDYAAEAAMKCGFGPFQWFLAERGAGGVDIGGAGTAIEPDKRAAMRLRSLLGVRSRADLNRDRQAADRWRRLKRDFDEWMKGRG